MFGGYPPTAIGYPPTAIGYTPTAIGYPPTAIGCPPTAIGCPPTAIGCPPTAIGYPPTAIGCPPTAIGYPPTAISYPPAAIIGRIGHSDFFFSFSYGNPWLYWAVSHLRGAVCSCLGRRFAWGCTPPRKQCPWTPMSMDQELRNMARAIGMGGWYRVRVGLYGHCLGTVSGDARSVGSLGSSIGPEFGHTRASQQIWAECQGLVRQTRAHFERSYLGMEWPLPCPFATVPTPKAAVSSEFLNVQADLRR